MWRAGGQVSEGHIQDSWSLVVTLRAELLVAEDISGRQKGEGRQSACACQDLQSWRKGPRVALGVREGQATGHQEEATNLLIKDKSISHAVEVHTLNPSS